MEAISFWALCKITALSHVDRLLERRRRPMLNLEDVEAAAPEKPEAYRAVPGSRRLALVPPADSHEEPQATFGACALLYLRKSSAP